MLRGGQSNSVRCATKFRNLLGAQRGDANNERSTTMTGWKLQLARCAERKVTEQARCEDLSASALL